MRRFRFTWPPVSPPPAEQVYEPDEILDTGLDGVTPRPHEEVDVSAFGRSTNTIVLAVFGVTFVLWAAAFSLHSGTVWFATIVTTVVGMLFCLRIKRGSTSDVYGELEIEFSKPIYPSDRVREALTDNEDLLWEGQLHPISIWKWWGAAILATLFLIFVVVNSPSALGFGLLIWLGVMIAIGIRAWLWYIDRLCVTTKRLIMVVGLFQRRVLVMPMNRLTDAQRNESALSRFLAWLRIIETTYGTIVVESAGQDQALSTIEYVPYVQHVYHIIMQRVNTD